MAFVDPAARVLLYSTANADTLRTQPGRVRRMPPPTAIDSLARKQRFDALANFALVLSAMLFVVLCIYMADESALRSLGAPSGGQAATGDEPSPESELAALPQAEQGTPVLEAAGGNGEASRSGNDLQQRIAKVERQTGNGVPGRDIDGVVYIPLSTAMSMVGGRERPDPAAGSALGISDHGLVRFAADTSEVRINEFPTRLADPVRMVGDELHVPVEAMAALYGALVTTDNRNGLVQIEMGDTAFAVLVPSRLFRIEISRGERWLKVFYAGKLAKKYPICAGAGNNTPVGEFHIQNKAVWPRWRAYWGEIIPGGSRRNPLGARWLGTTARGRATGWSIGIHGTNQSSSIGRRISGGCIRTYNRHAIELYETIPIGTPVSIHE